MYSNFLLLLLLLLCQRFDGASTLCLIFALMLNLWAKEKSEVPFRSWQAGQPAVGDKAQFLYPSVSYLLFPQPALPCLQPWSQRLVWARAGTTPNHASAFRFASSFELLCSSAFWAISWCSCLCDTSTGQKYWHEVRAETGAMNLFFFNKEIKLNKQKQSAI